MNIALFSAIDLTLDKPVGYRVILLAAFNSGFCALFYFLFLHTPLLLYREGQQQSAELQHKVVQLQKALLTQPALSVLLQQQRNLQAGREESNATLLEQIAAPLRDSKSALVKWQPTTSELPAAGERSFSDQGRLSLNADFAGLLMLMRRLVDGSSAMTLGQLSVQAGQTWLDAKFDLTTEVLRPTTSLYITATDSGARDPFAPAKMASCPDPMKSFKGVMLGGVIGDAQQRHGWLMWPGLGWQKALPGWRDRVSGWRVNAVEPGLVMFELDYPPCANQRFKLRLGRQ